MRPPPKLYRPQEGEVLQAAIQALTDSIEDAMAWIQEAVEKIEAAGPAEVLRLRRENHLLRLSRGTPSHDTRGGEA